ncbi:2-succinyl-5-enolpyruvyl-6-hydroxy-3-cyclohexene-1-carboxylic-acid synthase [Pseudarthrobacter sp. J1763]|uniref:2-succinyl-5-enolpyruvyl-6-hydroxy-3- cyclohexene-1-carboxylic-acid synthase n=1 Tax=Pseudarthrobacter sp. J1763 TaxID=3420445 RepID=UPI003D2BE100
MASARLAVETLIGYGVKYVVLAPGSRSAPLAYALAEAESADRIRVLIRTDERVAGFTALGLALGSGAPAGIVTTSGTAVGNLLPAVMEANHASVPLVVLSADRPTELRGTGANQTTVQFDLFAEHARFAVDVAAGDSPVSAIRTALLAAKGELPGTPAGPVQVNLAFRDPLTPPLDGTDWEEQPATGFADAAFAGGVQADAASDDDADWRFEVLPYQPVGERPGRAVVVAGHATSAEAGREAEYFARVHGLPLLAEPSSNARFGPNAVGPYRLLLAESGPEGLLAVDRVIVFGRPTLSRPVAALLARTDIPRALYVPRPVAWFDEGKRPETVIDDWEELSLFAGRGEDGWLEAWQAAGAAAEGALAEVLGASGLSGRAGLTEPQTLTGPAVARRVWAAHNGATGVPGAALVLGSSNPIRDVDLAGQPVVSPEGTSPGNVYANRGLAGIDGTISTATGVMFSSSTPTRVLLGDLTFLHDVGALLTPPDEPDWPLQIVVLNDSGGGIFSVLEHGQLGEKPRYAAAVERYFGTPHTVDIAHLAAAYGIAHRVVSTRAELEDALAEAITGRSIIEVRTTRDTLRNLHARIKSSVNAALR